MFVCMVGGLWGGGRKGSWRTDSGNVLGILCARVLVCVCLVPFVLRVIS